LSFVDTDEVNGDNLSITLSGPSGVSSGGEDVVWSWDANTGVLTGTTETSGELVATVSVADIASNNGSHSAQYTVTLLAPLEHDQGEQENILDLNFGFSVSDGVGQSQTETFTVKVEDDMPVASNSAKDIGAPVINTNLMIALDLSGSMKADSGVNNLSRLELAQQSLENLINKYDDLGDVRVRIVTFGTTADKQGDVWVSASQAISYLNALNDSDADGWTNYDAALNVAQDAFDDAGSLSGAQNVSYFVSDGVPTASDGNTDQLGNSSSNPGGTQPDHGIQTNEENTWKAFLDSNDINSIALGMGPNVSEDALNPVAYNGSDFNHGDKDAVIVSDLNQLEEVLEGTLVITPVSGSILSAGDGFGADDGYVSEVALLITIEGEANPVIVSFYFDGTQITNDYNGGGTLPDMSGSVIKVEMGSGSLLELDLTNGQYQYQMTSVASSDYSEAIKYTLKDTDGDTTSATVTLNVEGSVIPTPEPIAGDSIGTNVMIMLDVSGSMGGSFNGSTRLEAAKSALADMLNEYNKLGDVKVQLATFSQGTTLLSSQWMDIQTALNKLNSISNPNGGTNYDVALEGLQAAFGSDGKIDNAKNVSYFLSDGVPTLSSDYPDPQDNNGGRTDTNLGDGIDSTEQAAWQAFVDSNDIKSHAVAIGDNVGDEYLEPIAYDGEAGTELDATVPSSLSELSEYLVDSVVAPGQTFTGTDASDLIVGGLGEDFMTGNAGADSFIFDASTMGSNAVETDTITDFNQGQGDKLDLTDLLSGENASNLDDYLSFSKVGNDTLINVKADGSGDVDHIIKLENTDLTNNGNNTDQQIIDDLLSGNNLLVD
jgi:Mg-chelatase subunit ChlD